MCYSHNENYSHFLKLEHSSIYNKRESWYKAVKAGGGESSIQNTSSEIFLACCARAWATRLPTLLIQLKLAHYIPQTNWRTSSTTLPKSDRSAKEEDKASITLLLSPSITSLVKPASVANSTMLWFGLVKFLSFFLSQNNVLCFFFFKQKVTI